MKKHYHIEKGKLFCNDTAVFALGQSYYPSFHTAKYPVPPEGDRMGEMKKDLALMAEMGFNHVRFAAIGNTRLDENGEVLVDTPFVDAMIEEAEKNGISTSIRLQGYAVNLRGHGKVRMIDNKGNEQDPTLWSNFIQTTLHHEGMLEDNRMATNALARHFDASDNVVAFQIYNEPHYPTHTVFDYHPCAIAAYRKWLVDKGHMTEEEARNYEPPRSRKEQSPERWALWRLFAMESLTGFLNTSSDSAKEVSALPTYTCFTNDQTATWSQFRGVNNFDNPRGSMDILGYTIYINAEGEDYVGCMMATDICVTAAKAEGKEAWCIELDSRTKIPPRIFNKNTYATIGAGVKGILYYQWRGDYPSPATPIPNGCGLVNYDGSHTPNYDNAAAMVKLVNELSPLLIHTEPIHSHIGLFISDYANFCYDAIDNNDELIKATVNNTHSREMTKAYRDLTRAGYTVTFTDCKGLAKNALDIRVLFVPGAKMLQDCERAEIDRFVENGGKVYILGDTFQCGCGGYYPWGTVRAHYTPFLQFEEVLDDVVAAVGRPSTRSSNPRLAVRELADKDHRVISVVNTSCLCRAQSGTLECDYPVREATLYSNLHEPKPLKLDGNTILLEEIDEGGLIVVR